MFASVAVNFIIAGTLVVAYQGGTLRHYPVAPDRSLTSAVYIEKGLPTNDRQWGGSDYKQAAAVLKTLMKTDPTLLPRYHSPASGAMFARIVSPENFARFRNETFPRQTRMTEASDMLSGVGQILIVYNSAMTETRLFDSEEVELFRYILEISRDIMQLADARTGSRGAGSADDLFIDRDQMGRGLASIVSGSLRVFTEKNFFRPPELLRHADTMEMILPEIFSFLPAGTQLEINVRLQGMIKAETDPALRERLTRIAAALAKSRAG
jgi:hypothetical protein